MLVKIPKKIQTIIDYLRKRPKLTIIAGVVLLGILFAGYQGANQLITFLTRKENKPTTLPQKPVQIPAEQLTHLEKATSGECEGLYKIVLPEHAQAPPKEELCTHGPEMAASLYAESGQVSGSYSVPCNGDGTSGKRVQAVYAVASDKPDRYDEVVTSIRNWAGYADTMLNKSAEKTGAQAHIKWVTGAGCQLEVAKVIMSPQGDESAGYTDLELQKAGYGRSDRIYLTWVDDTKYCGLGLFRKDDRHDPFVNFNDLGRSYSRIDRPCWGMSNSVELHELLHNLGAVQGSTPHSTGFGHCTDEYDIMCYADGSGKPMLESCAPNQEPLLDCNNDDYFHSNPPEGSYLATHWNVFNSSFLYSKIPTNQVPPSPPASLVGTATNKGVLINWQPSTDDEGKAVTYKVFRKVNGGRPNHLATTSEPTYLDTSATVTNTTYIYFVAAFDPDGNASAQSNEATITIPATPLPTPDTTPPPALSGLVASDIGMYGFTLSWGLPADKSDIKYIVLLLNGATWATLTNTPSSYTHCCTLAADTAYTVRIKTVDAAGNYALGSQITVKTLPVPPPAPVSNIPYNLSVSQVNGAEVTVTANIDTTSGAHLYRLTPIGTGVYSDWFLPVTNTPQVRNFVHPQIRPQNVTGFYIVVFNSSGQETGRTSTLAFNYSGSPESNPPTAPAGFNLASTNGSSGTMAWSASTDDSGKVYLYHKTLTDNVTSVTTTLTSSYSTSAGLFSMVSGRSYTIRVKAEDIWGNQGPEAAHTFTFP